MDKTTLENIISQIPALKYKYLGTFAADEIPIIKENTFVIVNTDLRYQPGTHWIMLAKKKGKILFGDSLGRPLEYYKNIRLYGDRVTELVTRKLQTVPLCGFYAIYFAWAVFSNVHINQYLNDFELILFINKYL